MKIHLLHRDRQSVMSLEVFDCPARRALLILWQATEPEELIRPKRTAECQIFLSSTNQRTQLDWSRGSRPSGSFTATVLPSLI